MEIKDITEAGLILDQHVEEWNGNGSLSSRMVRRARRLSKNPVFNIAAWMKYNFGGCLAGETDADWLQSAKDVLKIARGTK